MSAEEQPQEEINQDEEGESASKAEKKKNKYRRDKPW